MRERERDVVRGVTKVLRALATEDYDLMERLLRVVYALASVEAAVRSLGGR